MKTLLIALLVLFVSYTIVGCTKGGDQAGLSGNVYNVTSTASSKQMLPSIDTTSSGIFTGLYDEQANVLTYTIAWADLWRDTKKDTLTAINFYGPATAASNGNLVRSVAFVNTNGTGQINLGLAGFQGLLPPEKIDFMTGAYYFTLITKRYPAGIIRGQLSVVKK